MCRGVVWTRWGDRSPGTNRSPAPMESVDRWPLASPDTQIPGGSRPAGAAVRRRVRGVRTPHPRPVCRRPHSARKGGLVEHPACGPVSEGLQWGQLDGHVFASPRCAGGLSRWPGARSPLPVYNRVTSWPLRGLWAAGDWRLPFYGGAVPGGRDQVIWLILPVVICLSQRLSHACLSISKLYGETANGSLNQLSFI